MLRPPRDLRGRVILALTVGAIGEVGWTIYLGLGLPERYEAHHWVLSWVGLHVMEIAMLLVTAYFAWRQRLRALPLAAAVTGTLYWLDAWFDVTTASRADVWRSGGLAFLEVPIGLALWWMAARALSRYGDARARSAQTETPSSESR